MAESPVDFDFLADDRPPRMCFDRILPPELREEAARLAIAEDPANRPRFATGSPAEAAAVTGKRWAQNRTLRIKFLAGDPAVQAQVRKWAEVWLNYVNLKFQWVGPQDQADIRIDASYKPADGSWSVIGTDALVVPADEPTMRLGWLLPNSSAEDYSSVVLHEFGHGVLALIHEHQNPAANIPWNKPKVYAELEGPPNNWDQETVDSNMFERYATDQTQYTQMDPASIMMYPIDASLTLNGFSVGWNTTLSPTDIAFARQAYPKAPAPPQPAPPTPTPPPPAPPPVTPAPTVPQAVDVAVDARPQLRQLTASGGADVYRVILPRPGTYLFSAVRVSGASLYAVELHGRTYPNGRPISRPAALTYPLTAGAFYFAVRAQDGRSTGTYSLAVRSQRR